LLVLSFEELPLSKVRPSKNCRRKGDFPVRLFVAIALTPELRNTFSTLLQDLRPLAPVAKFVPSENLHLTLKFLGEVPPSQLYSVRAALSAIRAAQAVTLKFHALEFSPNERHARVLWAPAESSSVLKSLAGDIDQALHQLGLLSENRPFKAHLTLARFYKPGLPPKFRATVAQNATANFGSLTIAEFHLMESKLKPGGAQYTVLESFPFVAS
jgi:2'-5' RNA ligase